MVLDAKRANSCRAATLDFSWVPMKVQCLPTSLQVARIAEVGTVITDIHRDIAAEAALVVDVLLAMRKDVALCLTKAKLF